MCFAFCCHCPCGETKKETKVTGLARNRSCTDLLPLLAFVISWIAIFVMVSIAKQKGADPNKIIRGVDMEGRICGRDVGVEDKKLAAWPHPLHYTSKICVKSCDETNDPTSPYMSVRYKSTKFVWYCIPSINASLSVSVSLKGFDDEQEAAGRAFADLYQTWELILISGGVALIISFLFARVIRAYAGCMIACAIALVLIGGAFVGYAMFKWGSKKDTGSSTTGSEDVDEEVDPQVKSAVKIFGGIVLGMTAAFALVVFFLRKQIKIAIEVVKLAADAVGDMKSIVFFPIVPFIFAVAYFAFWVYAALMFVSVSSPVDRPTDPDVLYYDTITQPGKLGARNMNPVNTTRFVMDTNWRKAAAYHFFHLLWVIQFLFYFGYLVFAGATAAWYFAQWTPDGSKKRGKGEFELSDSPVWDSFWRTVRYHMGTIAITSFIIAVIQFIRYCVKYLEEKTKSKPPNQLQQALFCILKCCLRCAECCMDKINKNALIWTAVYGDGFCTACCSSFQLVWRNLFRVAAVTVVSDVILLISKVAVALITAGIAAFLMTNVKTWSADLNSPLFPSIIVFILAYTVVSLFMIVFSSIIDTVFVCFLIDAEANKGGRMLAPPSLQKLVNDYKDASQQKADKENEIRRERPGHKVEVDGRAETKQK